MRITVKELKQLIQEAVQEVMKEEEGELKGKQKKLDVAPPFGKLDKYDFKKLGKISKAKAKGLKENTESNMESEKADLIEKWKGSGDKNGMSEQEFAKQLYYMGTNDKKAVSLEGLTGVREEYYKGWSDQDLLDVALAIDPKVSNQ